METVRLSVGGVLFETTKDTLSRSTYFNSLFNRWNNNLDNKPYFIDRSGKLFEHILGYLRNPEYPYPWKHYAELDFYGIEYDKKLIDSSNEVERKINIMFIRIKVLCGICQAANCERKVKTNYNIKYKYCDKCAKYGYEKDLNSDIKDGDVVLYNEKLYICIINGNIYQLRYFKDPGKLYRVVDSCEIDGPMVLVESLKT